MQDTLSANNIISNVLASWNFVSQQTRGSHFQGSMQRCGYVSNSTRPGMSVNVINIVDMESLIAAMALFEIWHRRQTGIMYGEAYVYVYNFFSLVGLLLLPTILRAASSWPRFRRRARLLNENGGDDEGGGSSGGGVDDYDDNGYGQAGGETSANARVIPPRRQRLPWSRQLRRARPVPSRHRLPHRQSVPRRKKIRIVF